MADEQWTRASDGSQGVFPGETGLVGTTNAAGNWAMWIPTPGVTYSAQYWGRELSVKNNGNGTYDLTIGANTRRHRYATRWNIGVFYDAAGNQIASFDAAAVPGDPSAVFFQPGYTEGANTSGTVSTSQAVQPVTVTQQVAQQTTAQVVQQSGTDQKHTRSSDGRTDVYAGDSGMVGVFDYAKQAWVIFMPPPGIDYTSYYWNGDIAMRNNGDGTYWLDADGVKAKRVYNGRWQPGKFYDRNGRVLSSPADATAQGDPIDIFFQPGNVAPNTVEVQGQSRVSTNPNTVPAAQGGVPGPSGTTVPGGTGAQVVYTGATVTPNGPGTANFPTTPLTSPDGGAEGSGNGKLLALAAVAALALLS